jgi:glycosyltransferase involved in cell wall biosynthesis
MNRPAPLTIARVIARLNVGGPATQAVLMTDAFRRKGYNTLLIAGEVAQGEESMEYLARDKNVQTVRLGSLSRRIAFFPDLQSLWQLIRIFRRERPTVLHTHTAKAGALGRVAAMLTCVPVRVHTFHGHVFHGYFSPWVTRLFIAIERLLASQTDCVIAISESQKHELASVYKIAPPDKIVVVPLGFQLDQFCENNQEVCALNLTNTGPTKPNVGWIGRMTAIKDPQLFVESAALTESAAKFTMVGDGELRSACETQIAASGLDEKVSIVGWQRNLRQIYSDFDLLVLTSINEGTPLAILEAMASGKTFVATDVGGVRDLMVGAGRRENGWERFDNGILTPRNPQIIGRAIDYLLSHEQLRQNLGRIGQAFVRSRYSDERLASDLENLYLHIAAKKKCIPTSNGQAAPTRPLPNSL